MTRTHSLSCFPSAEDGEGGEDFLPFVFVFSKEECVILIQKVQKGMATGALLWGRETLS